MSLKLKDILKDESNQGKIEHLPVFKLPEKLRKNEQIHGSVTVGLKAPHPNTTEHNIVWMSIYFLPEGADFPYQILRISYDAHGASVKGGDTSGIYSDAELCFTLRTTTSGTLYCASYCNIHGLWNTSVPLILEDEEEKE